MVPLQELYYIKVRNNEAIPIDAEPQAVMAPVGGQGDEYIYDWEYAGVDDEEQVRRVPELTGLRWLTCESVSKSWTFSSMEASTLCGTAEEG